jgi:two-component system response regulator AgrA
MIRIYICEDDKSFLDILKNMIVKIIAEEIDGNAKIMCAALNPAEILTLTEEDKKPALYFLDVDLGVDVMSGIELGRNIRIINPGAYVVMITAHADKAFLTYKYKLGAKGYILKEQIEKVETDLREHIINAYEVLAKNQVEEQKIIAFRNNGNVFTMYANQIYYIEVVATTQRKLRIYGKNEILEANAMLHEIEQQLDEAFYQCKKSYIVNMNHIKEINSKTRKVVLMNGAEIPISIQRHRAFVKHFIKFLNK